MQERRSGRQASPGHAQPVLQKPWAPPMTAFLEPFHDN